jgi:hypothetical protein
MGDRLVDFPAIHAKNLPYLFLTRICLYGSWRDVLKTIALMMNGTLQFLRLGSFRKFDLKMFPKERDSEVTDADLARFECQASWKYDGFWQVF